MIATKHNRLFIKGLKCCPFCGGKAYVSLINEAYIMVKCTRCTANLTQSGNSIINIMKSWNKRAGYSNGVIEALDNTLACPCCGGKEIVEYFYRYCYIICNCGLALSETEAFPVEEWFRATL